MEHEHPEVTKAKAALAAALVALNDAYEHPTPGSRRVLLANVAVKQARARLDRALDEYANGARAS